MTNTYANKSDLKELLDSCEEYMLQKQTALQIISEVLAAVKEWRSLAPGWALLKVNRSVSLPLLSGNSDCIILSHESEVKIGGCLSII